MLNKIIAIYAIIDDLLKAIGHREDIRVRMSDAEIITTALVAAMFFSGNHSKACAYMKDHKLVPTMLQKSRFNRRLHNLAMLINDLFHQIGMILKETSENTEYLLDSFPVPMCDPYGFATSYNGGNPRNGVAHNIRIFHVKLIRSEQFRGYIASKKRYFYGIRVQLLTTKTGIPVEFVFLPGSANDVRALNALPMNLPPNSEIYTDAAYTDYTTEDDLEQSSQISLQVMRKNNSKRKDPPWIQYIKQSTRQNKRNYF